MLNRDKYSFCTKGGPCDKIDAYTKDQVDVFLGEKSNITHNHNGIYVEANPSTNESIAIFNGINGEIKSSSAIIDLAGNLTIVGKLTSGAVTFANTDGTAGQVLATDGDGNTFWTNVESASGGTGDMLKNIYDTDSSGVVDNAEKVNNLTVETAVPSGAIFTDTVYVHPTTAGYRHIPAGGASGQVLVFDYNGQAKWGSVPAAAISMQDITDVEIDGATMTNGQQLVYDTSVYKWVNKTVTGSGGSSTLIDLTDTTISSPTAKQYLGYDSVGSKWVNMDSYSHPVGSGNNHIPAGGSSNQFLGYSEDGVASWQHLPVERLINLWDVDIENPVAGQTLIYDDDDQVWKNEAISGSGDMLKSTYDANNSGVVDNAEKVNSLTVETAVPSGAVFTDTIYTHPTTSGNKHIPSGGTVGQILVNSANGTVEWQDNSGGSGSSTLSELTDTNISGIADEQILKYNATSSRWENVDIEQIYNIDGGNASTIFTQNNINGGNA